MPIRVLLADDHALVRYGMRLILERLEGVEVIGEVSTGREAIEHVERDAPDVVLLDISMPDLNGIEAAGRIAARFPRSRAMILSVHVAEEYVLQALRAGAAGYVLKDATPAELDLALRAVARGETYLSPRVSRAVVGRVLNSGPAVSPLDAITPRQREILQLIAEGRATKQIAGRLGISVKTVETHRALLMDRLGIRDVAGLVRFAMRTGLVQDER